ncbi:MAG: DUF4426 domain-containing protein [Pseudomonadota bacterium]
MKLLRILIPTLLGVLISTMAFSSHAENSTDFGQYVVHYNALPTDQLPARVAREYHINRSKHRGMVNITVLRKVLGSPGQPVHAFVEVSAANLAGQYRRISVRQIREGNAIYYIGEFSVSHEETMRFDVKVRPQGSPDTLTVEFSQDFYSQ